jgi:hypothetical protein
MKFFIKNMVKIALGLALAVSTANSMQKPEIQEPSSNQDNVTQTSNCKTMIDHDGEKHTVIIIDKNHILIDGLVWFFDGYATFSQWGWTEIKETSPTK